MSNNQLNREERSALGSRIVIPCSDSYEFVTLSQVIRIEGLQNYSRVFLQDGSMLICTCNIGLLKKKLSGQGFVSCHKSHLINESHIVRYAKEGYVQMADESCVPVSRRQKAIFIEQVINKYDIRTSCKEQGPLLSIPALKSNGILKAIPEK